MTRFSERHPSEQRIPDPGYGLDAERPGTPAPGNRLQHRRTRNIGTVLSHDGSAWPAGIDPETWSYVRFDSGTYAYCPNEDLAPRNGEPHFGWPGPATILSAEPSVQRAA